MSPYRERIDFVPDKEPTPFDLLLEKFWKVRKIGFEYAFFGCYVPLFVRPQFPSVLFWDVTRPAVFTAPMPSIIIALDVMLNPMEVRGAYETEWQRRFAKTA